MARALMIDEHVRDGIAKLIGRASANPTSFASAQLLAQMRAAGVTTWQPNVALTILIPNGFRVTYTHEYQREDCICRHISISLDDASPNMMPHPAAVTMLLKEFGFINDLNHMPVWITDDRIIEFVEPLDGDVSRLRRSA